MSSSSTPITEEAIAALASSPSATMLPFDVAGMKGAINALNQGRPVSPASSLATEELESDDDGDGDHGLKQHEEPRPTTSQPVISTSQTVGSTPQPAVPLENSPDHESLPAREAPNISNDHESHADDEDRETLRAYLNQLEASQPLARRQKTAHALASDLASGKFNEKKSLLNENSPLGSLIALGTEAGASSLTMQLVLSCITNLASAVGVAPMVALEPRALPAYLVSMLLVSREDGALRPYALAATFNLSTATEILGALHEAEGVQLLQQLAIGVDADSAKRVGIAIKQIQEFATQARKSARGPSRPSSAMRTLTRVASFGRRKSAAKADVTLAKQE
mmetsp:Transcript_10645/g.23134  ORF Transcript_10645/g.23134 Transcript_10645/m.23134 type:complete len:338 (-) Transcript_10645:317-1330(-)